MSEPTRAIDPPSVAGERVLAHSGADSGHLTRTTAWPTNTLVSAGMWACLTLGLYMPIAFARPPLLLACLAAIPTLLSALTTKFLFEALVGSATTAPLRHWRWAVPLSGGVGFGVMAVSALIMGVDLAAQGTLIGAVCVAATLPGAVASRSVERRIGSSSRRIFFVGSNSQAGDLAREIGRRGDMRLVGVASPQAASAPGSALLRQIVTSRTTTLVVSGEAVRDEHVVGVASHLNLRGLRVRDLNSFYGEQFAKVPLSELSPSWFLFDVAEIHRARLYGVAKRAMETVIAAGVLLAAAPLLPFVALAVRLSSPGPILFMQVRVGKDGEQFRLAKFRTMVTAECDARPAWGTTDAGRITPVGRLLRRTRLDELPQLAQVISGHLSLVGPRPEQPELVAQLSRSMEYYAARHCVRPGLTGWAQVNYGYGGSPAGALEKLQYDFFYIKRQSLRLDLAIIAATVRIVVTGRGV